MGTLTLKKSRENQFGQAVFDALDQTGCTHIQAVRSLCMIAGSIALASAENEQAFTTAAEMAGRWFREGAESLSDLNKAVEGAH